MSGYRIIVVPSNIINSFDVGNAITLPEERYLEIESQTFNNDYSITRLPSNLFDVNDEQVRNNLEYVVVVLVVGIGNHQLSEFSIPFTLREQGIYSGDYIGEWNQDIINPVTNNCNSNTFFQKISITIIGSTLDKYSGNLICTDCELIPQFIDMGSISFITANNIISNFSLTQTIPCYCGLCVVDVDPCNAVFTGQGIITGDLNLEISYSGDDCAGFSEYTVSLFRQ